MLGLEGVYRILGVAMAAVLFGVLVFSIPSAYAVTTVTWDSASHSIFDGGINTFTAIPQFTVTDSRFVGVLPAGQQINVLVNSTSDPTGITLTLTESGTTGSFTGHVIFSNGTGLFSTSSSQTIGVNQPAANVNPNAVDTIISGPVSFYGIQVFSTTDSVTGTFMNLTETGKNTGIFENTLHFTTGPSVNGSSISVNGGDIVTITDISNQDVTNEIATPNPNAALGAVPSQYLDKVDVVYNGVKGQTILNSGGIPGGGGGGLIRPGTVLLGVLGGSLFTGVFHPPSIGNDYLYPYDNGITINGKSFDIENYSTTIPQQVLKIGTSANFGFKILDERGAYTISDVVMYFHFKGDPSAANADTWISWDKYRGTITHDPNKIFSSTSVNTTLNGKFMHANFMMIPQKTMPDSSLIMRMWDEKLAMGDVPIWGAIVIVDPNSPVYVKKIPTDQYGDYVTLENLLQRDGYDVPLLLNKMHTMHDIYTSIDINWVYDKGVDKLSMVESDKSGNLLGTLVCNLTKAQMQPTVTDHNYFLFTTTQLNRQDVSGEEEAKLVEAQKAVKLAEEMGLVRQSNFDKLYP
ncbi:hypothetical protein DYY67_1399 [Candidatus Nitrosotalea sp. TS]|uniref:hypothetical protein n=1 Tax=Candidatus Nitrosotalea sp. TS TaxID=2341020 RepID=UPI00140C291A|nr:hypothetical protein [Candidatus Nitrosotalea sp. TS]NHI04024.1 hypothetical protein [Candidatus Nitrosotalea sp. TS]